MRPQAIAMKALLDPPGLHVMPGCGDGLGARLIEEAGFRTGFVSGSSISAMRLAMPDMERIKAFAAAGADILFLDSPQSEAELREAVAAGDGRPSLAVASLAGRHFAPDAAELARIGVKILVHPQDLLAAAVHAMRAALAGLKGGEKPAMASPAELATAIRTAEYLARDARWPDPR
jgi:2-methylisocitrate lyase-like PEP mutase family enzyme